MKNNREEQDKIYNLIDSGVCARCYSPLNHPDNDNWKWCDSCHGHWQAVGDIYSYCVAWVPQEKR